MSKRANKELLHAILEPRKPGALQKIADAVSAGADPNAVCEAGSTSTGRVVGGSTLLTHSIDAWASKAVEQLLANGADPSLKDQNGWTPWMVSTLVDESKRERIQAALTEHGADQSGEHIGDLVRAIADGDVARARELIKSDADLRVLASFRVDLLGHQIGSRNAPMLEFLLEHGMQPSSTNFLNTVRNRNLDALDLLLRHGMPAERPDKNETPLMVAAGIGDLPIVQRLVEAGADVNRSADEGIEWTPSFYARQAGHTDVADWLETQMGAAARQAQQELKAGRDPRYRLLYEKATASESLSTDDIVERLEKWHQQYGVEVSDATGDSLAVVLSKMPKNLDAFVAEVLDICPDADDYEQDLKKALKKSRSLHLWWD